MTGFIVCYSVCPDRVGRLTFGSGRHCIRRDLLPVAVGCPACVLRDILTPAYRAGCLGSRCFVVPSERPIPAAIPARRHCAVGGRGKCSDSATQPT